MAHEILFLKQVLYYLCIAEKKSSIPLNVKWNCDSTSTHLFIEGKWKLTKKWIHCLSFNVILFLLYSSFSLNYNKYSVINFGCVLSFTYWQSQRETELDRVHNKRRKHLQEVCRYKKMTYLGFSPESDVRNHFVFDENSRIVYCSIEKVGSTFSRRLFQVGHQ